jgi:chemotaxis protein MotB
MRRKRKQPEPEQEAGAPEWMVTFSDCMTLLLTFFVLLLSFSSFDENLFRKLRVIFEKQFSISLRDIKDKEAFLAIELIQYHEDLDKGSEKPTLEQGVEDNLKEETEPANFHERKVFLVSSDKIFWGKGTVISFQGRKVLSDMASFLKEIPDKVVVSENGQGDEKDSEHLGLQRAWAVIEYFMTKQGLDKGQFSIAAGTLQKINNNLQDSFQVKATRMLEIVLLERSIHN